MTRYLREQLKAHHVLESFDCGKQELNEWLRESSRHAAAIGTARTYVWTDPSGDVVAYFALEGHDIEASDAPKRVARGSPAVIHGVLICKLALASSLKGQGHGGMLLLDAFDVALDAITIAGGRLIVVDAIDDEAARFYEHYEFVAVPERPERLFLKASTAAKALRRRWPPR